MKKPKAPPAPAVTAYYEDFRERLVSLRLQLNWSQPQMADALGLTLARYQKYEIRDKFPLHLIAKLALVTHRDVEFIVTGKISKPTVIRSRVA